MNVMRTNKIVTTGRDEDPNENCNDYNDNSIKHSKLDRIQ